MSASDAEAGSSESEASNEPEAGQDGSTSTADALRGRGGLGSVVEAGLSGEGVSAKGLLEAIGGWRGIAEAFVPASLYLGFYLMTRDARLSAIAPLALALIGFAWRLVRRETVQAALAGLVGVLVCVGVTLFTGRGEDYYLPGFWINGAWIVAHTVSLLVGWPLIGLLLGFLRGSLTQWRRERALRHAARLCTVVWIAVFGARLAVQLPLYFAAQTNNSAAVDALGFARLFMGIPLFALAVLFTWLVLKRAAGEVDGRGEDEDPTRLRSKSASSDD